MPNQPAGVFWAVVNRLLIIFQVLVLILSEVGWPAAFFERFFPVLGPNFGLGALGIFQCLIGATILSHHVDDFTLVAAFFLFSLGCLNMFLGLFRERVKRRRSIMSWREEAKGVLPTHKDLRPPFARPASAFIGRVFNRGEKAEPAPIPNAYANIQKAPCEGIIVPPDAPRAHQKRGLLGRVVGVFGIGEPDYVRPSPDENKPPERLGKRPEEQEE